MKIQDIMTRNVASCLATDNLNRAAQLMWEHDCGSIPVVDAGNRVVGMLTDRDIAMAAYTQGRALGGIGVAEIMTSAVQSCQASEPLTAAEKRMRAAQVRRLPVVDESGGLVGIISLNDLAIEAAHEKGVRKHVSSTDVALTLAEVCKHRTQAMQQIQAA
jgi:CBS domain-containing protein